MKYTLGWLQGQIEAGTPVKWVHFWGNTPKAADRVDKSCLSQWFPSPFTVDRITYPTAEHWMMAEKARLFGNHDIAAQIPTTDSPGAVKELGRKVKGFDEATWQAHRMEIVVQGNLHKFGQIAPLGEFLRNTKARVLVEASPVDTIWGVGMAQDHPDILYPRAWRGKNLLGFALMEVRDRLRG